MVLRVCARRLSLQMYELLLNYNAPMLIASATR